MFLKDAVPSSSGPGHRPLTPETGVRLPLGLPELSQGVTEKSVTPFLSAISSPTSFPTPTDERIFIIFSV